MQQHSTGTVAICLFYFFYNSHKQRQSPFTPDKSIPVFVCSEVCEKTLCISQSQLHGRALERWSEGVNRIPSGCYFHLLGVDGKTKAKLTELKAFHAKLRFSAEKLRRQWIKYDLMNTVWLFVQRLQNIHEGKNCDQHFFVCEFWELWITCTWHECGNFWFLSCNVCNSGCLDFEMQMSFMTCSCTLLKNSVRNFSTLSHLWCIIMIYIFGLCKTIRFIDSLFCSFQPCQALSLGCRCPPLIYPNLS